ncbi:MAG TPA: adenylyl-sulfate kinase, partial [Spirochaetota bacterium]|nr:adenylyl-sulfate kinase [Spirochaetota bacterium]
WFTGLSGSGKSTISRKLEKALFDSGHAVYILDGDNIRYGLSRDLGFSPADRRENIRRVAETARLLNDAGLLVITAFISPYEADRKRAADIIGSDNFIEVYVETPLQVCESRDPKGLYKKARQGEITDFTGISAPYEKPPAPALTLVTDKYDADQCVAQIMDFLKIDKK